jgi:hypothetical protein
MSLQMVLHAIRRGVANQFESTFSYEFPLELYDYRQKRLDA